MYGVPVCANNNSRHNITRPVAAWPPPPSSCCLPCPPHLQSLVVPLPHPPLAERASGAQGCILELRPELRRGRALLCPQEGEELIALCACGHASTCLGMPRFGTCSRLHSAQLWLLMASTKGLNLKRDT